MPPRSRKSPPPLARDDEAFSDPAFNPAGPRTTSPTARLVAPTSYADESRADTANINPLRPVNLEEFVGQRGEIDNLRVFIKAAQMRGDALKHVLLCGPPGLGKTTLARVIAREMNAELYATSGPAIAHKGDLGGMLSQLEPRSVFFIDEIHRLNPAVEETLYTAMEDGFFDMPIGQGVGASVFKLDLPPFTLVGATTRQGLLTKPLISRFGHIAQLNYYSVEELDRVVRRAAQILNVDITPEGSHEIARRSRGTPRIANRLLSSVRDFAAVAGSPAITRDIAHDSLTRLGVDIHGLDEMDRRLLNTLIERYDGGPAGIEALAAAIGEESDTLETIYEPYLVLHGFLLRTPRGRIAALKAYEHLGLPTPRTRQNGLFE